MTQAVNYIEIDRKRCSLTYGSSPCVATLSGGSPTGTKKCFNTFATCQDTANYDEEIETLRFSVAGEPLNAAIEAEPFIAGPSAINYSAAVLDPGQSMGQRASLSVTIGDPPHSDTGPGGDPYLADRSYNPFLQGTYAAKFRARNPYLRGQALRWYRGTAGQSLEEMECRYFLIDSFNYQPGSLTFIAKDTLKLNDGDRALVPAPSSGSLVAGITNSATTATLTPSGIGNTEYPASGYINLGGKETVSFTRSGDTLTIVRAQKNSVAIAHDGGTRCQICKDIVAQDPADIINDFEVNYAGVDSSVIPLANWLNETGTHLRRVYTAFITEPTAVKLLVNELLEQAGMSIWWSDTDNEIKLQVLRAIATDARTFDDTIIKAGSLRFEEQPKKRISRVFTYFAQFNPLLAFNEKDTSNFKSAQGDILTDAETADGKSGKIIMSRWIPLGGATAATRVNNLLRGRFYRAPRRFYLQAQMHDGNPVPILGEGVKLEDQGLQEDEGSRESVPAQIISVRPNGDVFDVTAEEFLWQSLDTEDADNRHIIIDNNANALNLRTLHDALFVTPVGGEEVELTIYAGVEVVASSTSGYGLNIGDWPQLAATGNRTNTSPVITNIPDTTGLVAGMFVTGTGIPARTKILTVDSGTQVTLDKNATSTGTGGALTFYLVRITVNVNGVLAGKGGPGGNSKGNTDNAHGRPGGAGGDALYTAYPFDLNIGAAGRIQAGGGGGGSGPSDYIGWWGPWLSGGGGGAGASYGIGGTGANGSQAGTIGALNTGGPGGNSNQGTKGKGGAGGARAAAGDAGDDISSYNGGAGGAPGDAIDGWTLIKEGTIDGSYYGAKVN